MHQDSNQLIHASALMYNEQTGDLKIIDWEYAGMHDPLIDVSMCSIYSYYTEEEFGRSDCRLVQEIRKDGRILWESPAEPSLGG